MLHNQGKSVDAKVYHICQTFVLRTKKTVV